jgi:hypothetical protein
MRVLCSWIQTIVILAATLTCSASTGPVTITIDPSCSTALPPLPSCTHLINSALDHCTGPPCTIQFLSATYVLTDPNPKQNGDPSRVILAGKSNVTFAGAADGSSLLVLDALAFAFQVEYSVGITWQVRGTFQPRHETLNLFYFLVCSTSAPSLASTCAS